MPLLVKINLACLMKHRPSPLLSCKPKVLFPSCTTAWIMLDYIFQVRNAGSMTHRLKWWSQLTKMCLLHYNNGLSPVECLLIPRALITSQIHCPFLLHLMGFIFTQQEWSVFVRDELCCSRNTTAMLHPLKLESS